MELQRACINFEIIYNTGSTFELGVSVRIDQGRLSIWMYRYMLGTLSKKKTALLKEALETRFKNNQTSSALERKFLAMFTVNRSPRRYLAMLIEDWEKRNYRD